ncbi:MAG: PilN domain-containing protein [Patescibacteria group bacterium]|nr:PilN domain-containing protein [Patescibacteria group bacterium]
MKEGINLASSYIKQSPREFIPEEKVRPPLPFILLLVSTALLGLVCLLILLTLQENELRTQKQLNQTLKSLSDEEKQVNLVLEVQTNLNGLQNRKASLTETVDNVLKEIPDDTQLTDLTVSPKSVSLSAETPSGASFARLIDGLLKSKVFKEILLTGSRFDQKAGLFSFNLICQITPL